MAGLVRVTGVAEIVLNVCDIAVMERFYTSVLGFGRHSAYPENEPTIVFLEIGPLPGPFGARHPQMLVLIDPARHAAAKGRFSDPTPARSTLNHLAFTIDDSAYEATGGSLRAAGIRVTPVWFEHVAAKALFIRDPEDNAIEFICRDAGVDDRAVEAADRRLRAGGTDGP